MRSFLLFSIAIAIGLMVWAVTTGAFVSSPVFLLSNFAALLLGYLLTETSFSSERKRTEQASEMQKKEITALKEEVDILQKQAALTTPQSEIDDLRTRLIDSDNQKNKLNSEFYAQAGIIANLNARLDRLQEEHMKMKEETTVTQEATVSEMESLRDKLSAAKEQLNLNLLENKTLKHETEHWKMVAAEFSKQNEEIVKANQDDTDETSEINAHSESDNTIESNMNGSDIFIKADEDLTSISGIGPKLETHLKAHGISNLEKFAELSVDNLKEILLKGGSRFRVNDPQAMIQEASDLVARYKI